MNSLANCAHATGKETDKSAGTREIGWRLYFRLRLIICHEGWQGHNTAPAKIQ